MACLLTSLIALGTLPRPAQSHAFVYKVKGLLFVLFTIITIYVVAVLISRIPCMLSYTHSIIPIPIP